MANDQPPKANPLIQEGIGYWHLGDKVNAGKCLTAGLAAAQADGDLLESGISHLYLGLIALGNDQLETAYNWLQESSRILQRAPSATHLALALAGLGRVNDEFLNVAKAQDAYLESLQISVEIKALPSLLLVLPGIALRLAKEIQERSQISQESTERLSQAIALYTLAIQHIEAGDPADLTWYEAVYGRHIGQIAFDLAPDIISGAQENGKRLDLWSTAVELETELGQLGWQREPNIKNRQKQTMPLTPSAPSPYPNLPAAGDERQKQLVLLDKVHNAWVKGVLEPLEQSIQNAELIALHRLRLDTAVNTPWADIIETNTAQTPLSEDESTLDLFFKTDRALLILGEPGSGKTTTLLQLTRDLISQARTDPSQPIPVVLNLSTWAEVQGNLTSWIVEELTAKYQIPRQLGHEWLDNNQMLLLLDGLDEMPADVQPKCIKAINDFRQTHGLTGLVICCRRADYEAHEARLQLGGAILIQPLSRGQIDAYLTAAGFHTAVLAELIEQDEALWELTESPLMLGMVRQAFSQEESDLSRYLKEAAANPKNDVSSHRRLFFAAFIDRMFKRRGARDHVSSVEIKKKLAWLAQRMIEHNQTIFLIEQLQPSWLPSRKWRRGYLIISGATYGVIVGILVWLTALIGIQAGLDLTGGLYSRVAARLQLPLVPAIFIFWVFLNLLWGILVGIIDGFMYDRPNEQTDSHASEQRLSRRYQATVCLVTGIPTTVIFAIFDRPLFALFVGALTAVYFMIGIGYTRQGLNFKEDIQTVEALRWSGRDAVRTLVMYGLPASIILGLLFWFLYERLFGIFWGLNIALFFFLVGGMRPGRIETNSKPNQGVRLSLRNSLSAALMFGVLFGLISLLVFKPASGLAAFAMLALIGWAVYGGHVVLKHAILRLMLWQNGRLPLNLQPFFKQTADLIFMRQVGGGFMFTHRLLQDYFASLVPGSQLETAVIPVAAEGETAVLTSKEIIKSKEVQSEKPMPPPLPEPSMSSPQERYILEELIGTGTMGKVYRGLDRQTGQTVAIKRLRAYLADEYPEAVTRFIREGEALQHLDHPNILTVLDVVNDEEQYLIVTEYLPGSLRDLLTEQSQLPIQQTVAIGLEVADALARAHHLDIIHRDVKPENILLAADGTPRLADFGVAHLGQHATRLTEEGGFMGTPLYISPEICLGEAASSRSDIWSLGIVLYEMLAGRSPFAKQQVMATLLTIVNEPIPDIKRFCPTIPVSLIFLLDQMLTKDPEQRLGRMRQVAAELERVQDDLRNPL